MLLCDSWAKFITSLSLTSANVSTTTATLDCKALRACSGHKGTYKVVSHRGLAVSQSFAAPARFSQLASYSFAAPIVLSWHSLYTQCEPLWAQQLKKHRETDHSNAKPCKSRWKRPTIQSPSTGRDLKGRGVEPTNIDKRRQKHVTETTPRRASTRAPLYWQNARHPICSPAEISNPCRDIRNDARVHASLLQAEHYCRRCGLHRPHLFTFYWSQEVEKPTVWLQIMVWRVNNLYWQRNKWDIQWYTLHGKSSHRADESSEDQVGMHSSTSHYVPASVSILFFVFCLFALAPSGAPLQEQTAEQWSGHGAVSVFYI